MSQYPHPPGPMCDLGHLHPNPKHYNVENSEIERYNDILVLQNRVKELEVLVAKLHFWYQYQVQVNPIPISDQKIFPDGKTSPYFIRGHSQEKISPVYKEEDFNESKFVEVPFPGKECITSTLEWMKSLVKHCSCGKPSCGRSLLDEEIQCFDCYEKARKQILNEN